MGGARTHSHARTHTRTHTHTHTHTHTYTINDTLAETSADIDGLLHYIFKIANKYSRIERIRFVSSYLKKKGTVCVPFFVYKGNLKI